MNQGVIEKNAGKTLDCTLFARTFTYIVTPISRQEPNPRLSHQNISNYEIIYFNRMLCKHINPPIPSIILVVILLYGCIKSKNHCNYVINTDYTIMFLY